MPIKMREEPQHGVVFYEEDDRFLSEAILDFCARALAASDALVVIATRPHLADLRGKLAERGFSWDAAVRANLAAAHDAEALLHEFCVDGEPDAELFAAVMQGVLAPWADAPGRPPVRAFGEMVDVLCREGRPGSAARLEEMWNELARSHRFTLLCAYSMGNLYREVNGTAYRRICDAHDHVLPWAAPHSTPGADLRA